MKEELPAGLAHVRDPSHVSQLQLELYAFSPELDRSALDGAEHIRDCVVCSTQVTRLRAERDHFVALRPPAAFALAITQRRAGRTGRVFITLLAIGAVAACVALVALVILPDRRSIDEPRIRYRGSTGLRFELHVAPKGSDVAYPHEADSELFAGDRLRFVVNTSTDGYVAVYNIDDRGRVSRYFPKPRASGRHRGGRSLALPYSIELDDFVGTELVCLLFSVDPLDEDRAPAALKQAYRRAKGELRRLAADPRTIHGPFDLRCALVKKGRR